MQTPSDIPLALQTTYAELLEQCAAADFDEAFAEAGAFTPKTVRGRRYWYFQTSTEAGRRQRYVGAETKELLKRIADHKKRTSGLRERQVLVSTLVRAAYLPQPDQKMGDVLAALAAAGVFRLRAVLVGTVAFQIYPIILGTRLTGSALVTQDIDIAQDRNISLAVEDTTPPVLDLLRTVNPDFTAIPHTKKRGHTVSYRAAGLRLDMLTPNRGAESEDPVLLPALGTEAQPLRFMDYLIRDPIPAVVLHNAGIFVHIPAPERYAVHKLIIAQRRQGNGKQDKDIMQAGVLLAALARKRPSDLQRAWTEAWSRGKAWRSNLVAGLATIDSLVRDDVLRIAGLQRSVLPGLSLRFDDSRAFYDRDRDVVIFDGSAGTDEVRCAISREALSDHYGADGQDAKGRVAIFQKNRREIEALARQKYLFDPVEPGLLLLRTLEIERLRATIA